MNNQEILANLIVERVFQCVKTDEDGNIWLDHAKALCHVLKLLSKKEALEREPSAFS